MMNCAACGGEVFSRGAALWAAGVFRRIHRVVVLGGE